MEVREDFMLSPAGDSEAILRTAHFLKPISNSIEEPPFDFNTFSSSSSVFDQKECPLKIRFSGWRQQQEKWISWVDELKSKYESVWKKAKIFEAIMGTKCLILRDQDLLFGVMEKWCSETNTFVFPFGEATITLEDIMVLGGYPVIGDPIFTKLQDKEMREVEKKMILAREQIWQCKRVHVYASTWMDIFIGKGSEIEHEAFLATWLSIFVFPHNYLVRSSLFPIAILLARGNPFALAPAVLAGIYKDLSLFKKKIVEKRIVGRNRSSRKHRPRVGNFKSSGIGADALSGFSPNLVDTLIFGKVCDDGSKVKTRKVDEFDFDVPYENSVHDCLRADQNIDADGSSSLPPKHNTLVQSISVEDCQPVLEEYNYDGIIHTCKNLEKELKDADGGKESRMSSDKVCLFETQGESCSSAIRNKGSLSSSEFGDFISSNVDGEIAGCGDEDEIKRPFYDRIDVNDINGESVDPFTLDMVFDLENRIEKLERVFSKLKDERFGQKVENV